MNIEVSIPYADFVKWLKAGEDTPYQLHITIPDSHVHGTSHVHGDTPSTCTSNVPDITCTSRNVHGSSDPSQVYVLTEPVPMPLPKGIKNIPSFVRNINLVKAINAIRKDIAFKYCNSHEGFKCLTALDQTNKNILITSSDVSFIENKNVQQMANHFKDYTCFLWCDNNLYQLVLQ